MHTNVTPTPVYVANASVNAQEVAGVYEVQQVVNDPLVLDVVVFGGQVRTGQVIAAEETRKTVNDNLLIK